MGQNFAFAFSILNVTPARKKDTTAGCVVGTNIAMMNHPSWPHTQRVVQVAMARGVQERLQEIVAKVRLRV